MLLEVLVTMTTAVPGTVSDRVEGVTTRVLAGELLTPLPQGRVLLTTGRLTLAPGARLAWAGPAGPTMLVVEAGTLALATEGASAWVRSAADGASESHQRDHAGRRGWGADRHGDRRRDPQPGRHPGGGPRRDAGRRVAGPAPFRTPSAATASDPATAVDAGVHASAGRPGPAPTSYAVPRGRRVRRRTGGVARVKRTGAPPAPGVRPPRCPSCQATAASASRSTRRTVSWLIPTSAASDRRLLVEARERTSARSSADNYRGRSREYGARPEAPTVRRTGGSPTRTNPVAVVRA